MTGDTKRLFVRAAIAPVVCLGLGACTAFVARTYHETEHLRVEFGSIRLSAARHRTTLSGDSLSVTAKPGKKVCDVSIEVVHDTNGNGIPGDAGDQRRVLAALPGVFKRHGQGSFGLFIEASVKKAYLVIRGRDCSQKKVRVLGAFEITRGGVSSQSQAPEGPAVAFCGEASRPHFVEAKVREGTLPMVRITAGDLRAVSSPMRKLYEHHGGLSGNADFLGAAVFVEGHLVAWILSDRVGHVDLPLVRGLLGRVDVVTLDRSLNVVGQWRFSGLRS